MIWQPFLQYLAKDAPQWKAYSEAFIEGMTWMQEVTKDKLVPSLWHMHPLVFLDAINTEKTHNIIFPLRTKPLNNPDGDFKAYNWRDRNKGNQTVFGRNRNGGRRKHAAIDLYTKAEEPIVAICEGKVIGITSFYKKTDQITIQHKTKDGREFIIRYGEVSPKKNLILVKKGDVVKQGQVIGHTGLLREKNDDPSMIINKTIIYMLHFEYYTDSSDTATPLTDTQREPYLRRKDIADPIEILTEGYNNTFSALNNDAVRILRLRAFMQMIRTCEGTAKYDGYYTIFSGEKFTDDSKHPEKIIRKSGYASSATGAYQITKDTWAGTKKQYNLPDFTPRSQDFGCITIIAACNALSVVLNGNITQGITLCNTQWASLPNSPHNQPTEKLSNALAYYDTFLEQEKNNISSLVATVEEMTKFIKLNYPTVNL
ncbi:peptidoglycan DD-metalloendopeptidase family protein [Providencia stuartii]|uniref:peptidoglycan DD-metalloendopeptidase family protein n=1 Tax=Providencia stuartii TaxID=588 RepID=UPI0030F13D9A